MLVNLMRQHEEHAVQTCIYVFLIGLFSYIEVSSFSKHVYKTSFVQVAYFFRCKYIACIFEKCSLLVGKNTELRVLYPMFSLVWDAP